MTTEALAKQRTKQINALYEGVVGRFRKAAEDSLPELLEIGRLLTEQKADLAHGKWLPWVASNLPFGEREARNYMRVYAKRDDLNRQRVADFSLRETIGLLAAPEPETALRAAEINRLHGEIVEDLQRAIGATVQASAIAGKPITLPGIRESILGAVPEPAGDLFADLLETMGLRGAGADGD